MMFSRIVLLGIIAARAAAQTLAVIGDVPTPLKLTADDLAKMPRETVTIPEQDGTKVEYEGVTLREIMKRAGTPLGKDLRGKGLASYIVAKARDGYQVVFTLGEIDADFGNESILVADKRAGKALFDYQGPFRLVCPGDKAGARSVRMLETLEWVKLKPAEKASLQKEWIWDLPKGFPAPHVPADNPMTPEKVELGRYLFYDARLSVNGTQSCASCHQQERAFTDGRAVGVGATGEHHQRGPMSLVNVAFSATLTWNNPDLTSLEEQALTPMFGDKPVELGLSRDGGFLATLKADVRYKTMFAAAFPKDADPFTVENVTRAVSCFERSIISARSPYDRYHYGGDDTAISAAAKRGEVIYFSQPYTCFRCHGGFDFSSGEMHDTPEGKFKAPTLRNIALTAPYMHDGSLPTLQAVIERHANEAEKLSASSKQDLIAFLDSLTDRAVTTDPRFAKP
jgi:cytochrome c peroxidase